MVLKTLVARGQTTMNCNSIPPLRTNVMYVHLHSVRRQLTCRTYYNYAATVCPVL